MAELEIQPPVVDLSFYAGDGVALRFTCTDDAEPTPNPIPLTGTVEAQIRVDREQTTPVIVTFSSDLTNYANGIVVISLTGEQCQDLVEHPSTKKGKFKGVWDLEWTATGAEPRTLVQGDVECMADVTR